MPVYELPQEIIFPPSSHAEPDGLLAVGGDLSPVRLIKAYKSGLFPWFSPGDPILWWTPDPRFVLFPEDLHISRSTKRLMKKKPFHYTYNTAFQQVINYCKTVPRDGQEGTWITKEMEEAYLRLHKLGHAVSVEVWQHEALVGGVYGIIIGKAFFGESMFSLVPNASKLGIIHWVMYLKSQNFRIIDCQMYSRHMESLGAVSINRKKFEQLLQTSVSQSSEYTLWNKNCLNPKTK